MKENDKGLFSLVLMATLLAILSLGAAYIVIGGVNYGTALLFASLSILAFYFPKIHLNFK